MKKHIICLGDSNTHGKCADPADCEDHVRGFLRFNEQERWPCLLADTLGSDYLIIEEGLTGRTTVFPDPLYEGMSALDYIVPCMKSHEPVDILIIMLGTNDMKERFAASALTISRGMERLIKKAKAAECWANEPNILLICPPAFDPNIIHAEAAGTMGAGCVEKSRYLASAYARVAQAQNCRFLDANGLVGYNQIDYMHLTKKGHAALAKAVAALIPEMP